MVAMEVVVIRMVMIVIKVRDFWWRTIFNWVPRKLGAYQSSDSSPFSGLELLQWWLD